MSPQQIQESQESVTYSKKLLWDKLPSISKNRMNVQLTQMEVDESSLSQITEQEIDSAIQKNIQDIL